MKHLTLLLLLLFSVTLATAQERRSWEALYEELMTADDAEAAMWEENFELLSLLEEQPLDLNRATQEDLERLPFLTAQQVEDIQAYIYQYGGMRSLGELAMIESLDRQHQQLHSYFIYLGEEEKKDFPSLKNIARYGRHELVPRPSCPSTTAKATRAATLATNTATACATLFLIPTT